MTSIEWLIEQLMERGFQEKNFEILNQAKLIHKQEIIDAYTIGSYDMAEKEFKPEQYYQETFVSKGSDNHISDISKMVEVPQQEISDEEIEKSANYFYPLLGEQSKKALWINGCKWYREQLKTKT